MRESFVEATLQYSRDVGRPLDYYFYEPSQKDDLNPPGTDGRLMKIYDAWKHSENWDVDRHGFEIHDLPSQFEDFGDEAAVKQEFYQDVITFVKKHTGASRVIIFDHTIRRRMPADLKVQTEQQRPAVLLVHSDYTERSAPQRVRDLLPEEADFLLQKRVAFYNVWKPLCERVEELPLAMCDAQTSEEADMLRMDLKYADRTGEIFVVRHSPKHRWYYFPLMQKSQALLLKTYDSLCDGRARFMAHTAFEDPTSTPDAIKRESIEVRTMAFFD